MDLPSITIPKSKSKKYSPNQEIKKSLISSHLQSTQQRKLHLPPMVMMITTQENSQNPTAISPTWKLYENPFYNHISHQQDNNNPTNKQIHHLHLPVSARKIAASFWDLTFIKPLMESELEVARSQIVKLKADLECERKARKKTESLNKRLTKELSDERKGSKALERVCEDLAKKVSFVKSEFDRMKKEMDEERKMLRVSEVIREERVQMKLTEAKILLEEKLLELEDTKRTQIESSNFKKDENNQENDIDHCRHHHRHQSDTTSSTGDNIRFALTDKTIRNNADNSGKLHSMAMQRRASPEAENPHIKRGIKGFVEFPKVARAIGCRRMHMGTKLECQKAQLSLLLKQKGPARINGLIATS